MRHPLRLQPILIALTLVNLGILVGVVVSRERAAAAPSAAPDGMLRGRGLQIVDEQGRVRASITLRPAARQPDGSTYPETVLLRMITSEGRPVVKISSSEDGAAMALTAAEGPGLRADCGARQCSPGRHRRRRRQTGFEAAVKAARQQQSDVRDIARRQAAADCPSDP